MGEAKRKQQAAERAATEIDIARVSQAIRKVLQSTSTALGVDCHTHAALGRELLKRLGVSCELALGYASWRVGGGDIDVIAHHPAMLATGAWTRPGGPGAELFHAWVQVGSYIYDSTTYQLRWKCEKLDAQDGRTTVVDWCPEYLFVPRSDCVSWKRVRQERAGMFSYERVPELEAREKRDAKALDEELVSFAWLVYRNPDVIVVGPNDVEPTIDAEVSPAV